LFNKLEEWRHRPKGTNPFSGNGRATVGKRRKKAKDLERRENGLKKAKFYTLPQIKALLAQADKEVKEDPNNWERRRLQALTYFEAYTGARIEEVVFLEWEEIDYTEGIAYLNAKVENQLKTEGSEAPVGLSETLSAILKDWEQYKTCNFVFPNTTNHRPWTGGGPGYKSRDQLKAMAKRAGIEHANWQMFRHSLTTHGKLWFGLSKEQIKASLRHSNTETQRTYTHDDLLALREIANAIRFGDSNGKIGSPSPATAPSASAEESPRP
jgi:integrase